MAPLCITCDPALACGRMMSTRVLDVADEAVARAACAQFSGLRGELDVGAFLSRRETTLIVVEDVRGVVGWVYGHELVPP